MLSLANGYARLTIRQDEEFGHVSESIRALLHVCRLNGFRGALVVSDQDAFDWRSSLRIGLRFAAARGGAGDVRLALVVRHFNDGAREDVLAVAREAKLECRIFRGEEEAIAWLGGGKPPSGESRRAQ
jgi:hypothetical protein